MTIVSKTFKHENGKFRFKRNRERFYDDFQIKELDIHTRLKLKVQINEFRC